jgi:hypothetical protein
MKLSTKILAMLVVPKLGGLASRVTATTFSWSGVDFDHPDDSPCRDLFPLFGSS